MAYDKLVDSTQLDSDLASIADAIRAKAGISEELSFPDGFVSGIANNYKGIHRIIIGIPQNQAMFVNNSNMIIQVGD